MPCSGIKPMEKPSFTKDSIEAAYCFFHQKWQVYAFSEYVNEMSPALYETLAKGKEGFLLTHTTFADDMKSAVEQLGNLL